MKWALTFIAAALIGFIGTSISDTFVSGALSAGIAIEIQTRVWSWLK